MKLISDYRENEMLRTSFFKLAKEIFSLDFSSWYGKGYWGDRYVPYSYADGDTIVANASVNKLDFVIDGHRCKGLQIGTVMTHPDYRGKGLAASLMNHILEEYKDQYDIMYLFANDSVLDFYPRFGFERAEESLYSLNWESSFIGENLHVYPYGLNPEEQALRKLDVASLPDLELIEKAVMDRIPVSRAFGTAQSGGITMYHVLNVFPSDLYYMKQEDTIVIFSQDNHIIHLFDVISRKPINFNKVLNSIVNDQSNEIVFHYTPDYKGFDYKLSPYQRAGALFVKTNGSIEFSKHVKHPVTSEA